MKEIWKPLPLMPNDYEISNLSRVRSIKKVIARTNGTKYTRNQKVLKPAKSEGGYFKNAISNMGHLVSFMPHRQCAIAFIPNPHNKPQVNHKNGIKTDNSVSNLEWMTASENCKHSFDIGIQKPKRGALNGMAKLTEEQVLEIRKAKNEKGRYWGRTELAKKFGVSSKHVQEIANNKKLWESVSI